MPTKLTERQLECLRAVADGTLKFASRDGGGTFTCNPFRPNTLFALEERGLVTWEQDAERFWKLNLSLTDKGRAFLAELGETEDVEPDVVHICEACARPSTEHAERCTEGEWEGSHIHWPPLCCEGCPCKSFEMAHPKITMRQRKLGQGYFARGGFGMQMGYTVSCSCGGLTDRYGGDLKNNEPKYETVRDIVRPHLREVHGIRGKAADRLIP